MSTSKIISATNSVKLQSIDQSKIFEHTAVSFDNENGNRVEVTKIEIDGSYITNAIKNWYQGNEIKLPNNIGFSAGLSLGATIKGEIIYNTDKNFITVELQTSALLGGSVNFKYDLNKNKFIDYSGFVGEIIGIGAGVGLGDLGKLGTDIEHRFGIYFDKDYGIDIGAGVKLNLAVGVGEVNIDQTSGRSMDILDNNQKNALRLNKDGSQDNLILGKPDKETLKKLTNTTQTKKFINVTENNKEKVSVAVGTNKTALKAEVAKAKDLGDYSELDIYLGEGVALSSAEQLAVAGHLGGRLKTIKLRSSDASVENKVMMKKSDFDGLSNTKDQAIFEAGTTSGDFVIADESKTVTIKTSAESDQTFTLGSIAEAFETAATSFATFVQNNAVNYLSSGASQALVSTFSDLVALVASGQKIDTKKVLTEFVKKTGQFTIAAGLTDTQYAQAVAVKNNRHTVLSAVSSLRKNVKMRSHFVLFYFTGCRVKHGMTTPLKPFTTPHPHNDNLPQSCHNNTVKNVA